MKTIYLDNAATTWPKPETVYQAVDDFQRNIGASPGRGGYKKAVHAGRVVEHTRSSLAAFFNIRDHQRISFTSSITEALNTCLKGMLKPGDHVIISSLEHNSVYRPLYALSLKGVEFSIVPCDRGGRLNPSDVQRSIKKNTRLVCMLHASNVTGTILPIEEIIEIAHRSGVLFMLDAAQTAGVVPIDVTAAGIDLFTFTGHKGLMGPQGTGGFYVKPGLEISPLKEGGTGSFSEHEEQPRGMPDAFESGTLNTVGIAGLGAGIEFITQIGVDTIYQHEMNLTRQLAADLGRMEDIVVYGNHRSHLQTGIVSFNIEGIEPGVVAFLLDDLYNIAARSGLHCAPLAHKTIGTFPAGTCRLSPGWFTSQDDIEIVIDAVRRIARRGFSR